MALRSFKMESILMMFFFIMHYRQMGFKFLVLLLRLLLESTDWSAQ